VVAGEYRQSGDVAGEVAAAVNKIDIDGAVGDDLYVASQQVHIGADARVGRNARITGRDVLIKGRVDGDLDVTGETVAVSAQVGGNVSIRARHIVLGPNTTIEGTLKWKSAEPPDIATDAIISHGVTGSVVPRWQRQGPFSWDRTWGMAPPEAIFAGEAALRIVIGLSAFLIGAAFALAAPHLADALAASARAGWPKSLGWGVLIMIAAPLAAVVLALTIIAAPLALLALMAYPLLLLLGFSAGSYALGAAALRGTPDRRRRVLSAAAGAAALTALSFLPWLGVLAGVLTIALGLGACAVRARAGAAARLRAR